MNIKQEVNSILSEIRRARPLIHHLTNGVTINDCANITLAVGASPVMSTHRDEVREIVRASRALVLNIGMISDTVEEAMHIAGEEARSIGVPIVLDPVGAGATKHRRDVALGLIEKVRPTIIRGNVSELRALLGEESHARGVDSIAAEDDGLQIALRAAKTFGCSIAMTGARDIITDGQTYYLIQNGHSMLTRVTGTGCMTTSLIASALAVADRPLAAAVTGVLTMGLAGEMAHKALFGNAGVGAFHVKLFDAVFALSSIEIEQYAKIQRGEIL